VYLIKGIKFTNIHNVNNTKRRFQYIHWFIKNTKNIHTSKENTNNSTKAYTYIKPTTYLTNIVQCPVWFIMGLCTIHTINYLLLNLIHTIKTKFLLRLIEYNEKRTKYMLNGNCTWKSHINIHVTKIYQFNKTKCHFCKKNLKVPNHWHFKLIWNNLWLMIYIHCTWYYNSCFALINIRF
jgi:hypothetical protein